MHRLGGRYVLWCSSAWWSLTIWIRALPRGCLIPPATVSGHWKGLRELKTPPRSTRLLAFCLAGNIICVWKGFFCFFFKWKRYIFLKVQKLTGDCFTLEAGHPAYFLLQSWYFFPKKSLWTQANVWLTQGQGKEIAYSCHQAKLSSWRL